MSTQRLPTGRDREEHAHGPHGPHRERVERQVIVTGGHDRGAGAVIAGILAVLAVLVILGVVLVGDAANDLGNVVPEQVDIEVEDGDGGAPDPDARPEGDADVKTTN